MSYEFLTSLGRQVADHLWQSTVFAIAIGVLARALRANPARARYRLWLAASLKFLLPFSLLSSIGVHLAPRFAPAMPAPRISFVLEELAAPLAPLHRAIAETPTSTSHLGTLAMACAFALWILGCTAVVTHFLRRWRSARAIVRSSTPLRTGRAAELWNRRTAGIELVSSQAALEPGVFGIFRPVLYLPAKIVTSLSEPELDAILAHELCHVRRRDNLTAALHMVVEAIFWFHPLVWWLGARLVEERERACDEDVLLSGVEPMVYAEGILQVCSQCLRAPSAWVAGATGSSLKKRIEEIVTNRMTRQLGPGRKLLLAAVALVVVVVPVITGVMSGPRLSAQPTNESIMATPSGPRFEVASIKPAPLTNGQPPTNAGIRIDAGRVDIGYWSIQQLILRAYGLPAYQVSAPGWTHTSRFDVVAKFPDGATRDQLPEMLQSLLAERFGLTAHVETKELPGFALVVGKGGLKIKPGVRDANTAAETMSPNRLEQAGRTLDRLWAYDGAPLGVVSYRTMPGVFHVEFNRMPMEALAQICADRLKAPVINRTGLDGEYQMTLDLPLPNASTASVTGVELPPALEPVSPSIFDMVERLGLRLEQRKTPLSVLVVDHVNQTPTEN
jgi:bla regulator protein blaR1